MGEVISIVSGKGGTGKTTLCATIATCLAVEGKKVLCIDADVGLRNLDISLGMADQPIIAFTDVMSGHYQLSDATEHADIPNLFLLTAPVRENNALIDSEQFGKMLDKAREEYDFCLIDSSAGISDGFRMSMTYADHNIVVSTPDPASLRDAERVAEMLLLAGKENIHLIVNRITPKLFPKMELTIDDIMDDVGLPLLGIVPEDQEVVLAANNGEALIFAETKGAAEACLRMARRLCGIPTRLMKF